MRTRGIKKKPQRRYSERLWEKTERDHQKEVCLQKMALSQKERI